MIDVVLTKKSDKLLCLIYKEYLTRNKRGRSLPEIFDFDFFESDCADVNNISDILDELGSNSLITHFIDDSCELLPNGIIYMENRFPGGLKAVAEYLFKIIPLVL